MSKLFNWIGRFQGFELLNVDFNQFYGYGLSILTIQYRGKSIVQICKKSLFLFKYKGTGDRTGVALSLFFIYIPWFITDHYELRKEKDKNRVIYLRGLGDDLTDDEWSELNKLEDTWAFEDFTSSL